MQVIWNTFRNSQMAHVLLATNIVVAVFTTPSPFDQRWKQQVFN